MYSTIARVNKIRTLTTCYPRRITTLKKGLAVMWCPKVKIYACGFNIRQLTCLDTLYKILYFLLKTCSLRYNYNVEYYDVSFIIYCNCPPTEFGPCRYYFFSRFVSLWSRQLRVCAPHQRVNTKKRCCLVNLPTENLKKTIFIKNGLSTAEFWSIYLLLTKLSNLALS